MEEGVYYNKEQGIYTVIRRALFCDKKGTFLENACRIEANNLYIFDHSMKRINIKKDISEISEESLYGKKGVAKKVAEIRDVIYEIS